MTRDGFLRYFGVRPLWHVKDLVLRLLNSKIACLATILAALPGLAASADDVANRMQPPRLSTAEVDWASALAVLAAIPDLQDAVVASTPQPAQSDAGEVPQPLARLNTTMSARFAGIAASPIPVLLPFDTEALLRDVATGTATDDNARYLSGFRAGKFFYPGPSGYDAAFSLLVSEVAEFSDIKFAEPIEVQISGSVLLYRLEGPTPSAGLAVPELDADFPGIRRLLHEHHLRYTFVRYGVPYAVSIGCFDAGVSRYKMPTCRAADRVARRFLGALRIAGGTPKPHRTIEPAPLERPTAESTVFRYRSPGRLLGGTDFRDRGGRADYTVYARIRFPLEHAPAYANTEMFQRRSPTPGYSYPWRDNFCERRGFPVGQCPAGIGHQGQDIRSAPCSPQPCRPHDQLVAVRDGAILRSPRQEAAYLFVNTATEHLRFRYLHMNPNKMDAEGLLSGRLVREGEIIGEVSNFSRRENGTSYHLHFDVQVPTRDGWVFVNPYMTLVAAYERLIAGRGTEIDDAAVIASGEPDKVVGVDPPSRRTKSSRFKRNRHVTHRNRSIVVRGHQPKKFITHRMVPG